jgi:hypothetical protein
MNLPDRLTPLIRKLEGGQPVTRDDLDRTAALQALDLAKLGEDFVRETIAADTQHSRDLEALQ